MSELAGDLDRTPLAALLPALAGETGLLTLTDPTAGSVRLWLHADGAVLAERRDASGHPRPELLHRLQTAGLLAAGEAAAVRSTAGGRLPVEHLVDSGRVRPRQLAPHVTELLFDAVATAAAWTDGEWTLDRSATVPAFPAWPAETLLASAADRAAESGSAAELAAAASAVPALEPARAYADVDLAPEAWAVLTLTDGSRSTSAIADLCGLTVAEAVHVVGALSTAGLLRCGAAVEAPVFVPSPHRAVVPPFLDDLQVIMSSQPDSDEPAAAAAAPPGVSPPPSSSGHPALHADTAAFLRELSAFTEHGEPSPAEPPPARAPAEPTSKTPRRRLFGR